MLQGSILQQLEVAHQAGQTGKAPLNYGVYYKNTLIALCHALEDCILTSGSPPLVIAAFQRGKWYLQEAERYGDIAERSRQIVIMAAAETGFAEHPTSQRSNVALVELDPADPVAQEWHLIILAPTYTAMVLCQELSAADYGLQGAPAEDRERKFYGFWTFEPELVHEVVELAIAQVGRYNPELQKTLMAHQQAIVADSQKAQRDDLGPIVSRVVDYLQTSQEDLSQLEALAHQTILDHNLVSNELQAFLRMAQLIDLADATNPMAAAEVAALAEMMGQLLDLPAWQIKRLRLASLLHRIAPLQGSDSILSTGMSIHYQDEASSCPLTCPLVPGAQVLRTLPRLRAIAQIITHQTEWWNGMGQPAGLVGDEIPLESRILGLVAAFQERVTHLGSASSTNTIPSATPSTTLEDCLGQVLTEFQAQKGDRWDPKLVETLALLVMGLQQGLSLPITPPKVAAGMWLLDFQTDSEAWNAQETSDYAMGQSYGY